MGEMGVENPIVGEEESSLNYMRRELLKISSKLKGPTTSTTIHRVVYDRRQDERSPYDPRVISIGPFHRGEERLKAMEKRKWRYLHGLLRRGSDAEGGLERYVKAAEGVHAKALSCYSNPKKLSEIGNRDFVVMLVLDGCFLMSFLLKGLSEKETVMDDFGWKLPWIRHDILLLENQIPFFVLEVLFEVYRENRPPGSRETYHTMLDVAGQYLYRSEFLDQKRNFQASYCDWSRPMGEGIDPSHLLHLYHKIVVEYEHRPTFDPLECFRTWTGKISSTLAGVVYWPMFLVHHLFFADSAYPTKITAAHELQEAGVTLQGSFMDLRFEDGTLSMPVFSLDYHSFALLKNLIALEVYHPKPIHPFILSYAEFLTELIKTPKDLEMLDQNHIIETQDIKEGVRLVGGLLAGLELEEMLVVPTDDFGYWQHPRERKEKMLKYCEQPRHRWRAKLMKDYFSSPWSTIGVFVATVFLALTIVQTVFTVLPYYVPPPEPQQ